MYFKILSLIKKNNLKKNSFYNESENIGTREYWSKNLILEAAKILLDLYFILS